jgi:hypothetical protein
VDLNEYLDPSSRVAFLIMIAMAVCLLGSNLAGFFYEMKWNCTEANGCRLCTISSDDTQGECSPLSQTSLTINAGCVSFSVANSFAAFDAVMNQHPPQTYDLKAALATTPRSSGRYIRLLTD